MEPIKDTIESVIQALKDKKRGFPVDDPQKLLKKALTKKEQGHIKFNYFKKGILGVQVDSSSRLYSLSLQKETLLEKLKSKIPQLKDIRFRIGEIK